MTQDSDVQLRVDVRVHPICRKIVWSSHRDVEIGEPPGGMNSAGTRAQSRRAACEPRVACPMERRSIVDLPERFSRTAIWSFIAARA